MNNSQGTGECAVEGILCIPRLTGGFIHLLNTDNRAVLMTIPVKVYLGSYFFILAYLSYLCRLLENID